ncbi:alpha/beta fold hydrolase [Niveispirillum sp. KHB5.9]|uniref:alpha/beta fold hydrolase n=1 Tax=Niveispirillum sp. KHB5.9 TaxID=3400269 RepID=UPI003A850641
MIGMLGVGMALAGAWTGGLVAFSGLTARRVERALPAQGKFLEVDGQRLHYLDVGSGTPLVMIHGLGGQMRHFSHGLLAHLTDRYRVILVDRPGSGHSTRAHDADASPGAQAAAIAGLIRALGLDRPLVVGHSLGGAVALALALDHPDCAGALALIAPLTRAQDSVPPTFKGLIIPSSTMRWLISWTLATPMSILHRDRVLGAVFGPDPVPADFALAGGALLGLRPVAFRSASADLMAAGAAMADLEARYGGLRLPISILYGRDDRVLDWRHHGETAQALLPGATLTLTDGGHMLPLTAPAATAAWLDQCQAGISAPHP